MFPGTWHSYQAASTESWINYNHSFLWHTIAIAYKDLASWKKAVCTLYDVHTAQNLTLHLSSDSLHATIV